MRINYSAIDLLKFHRFAQDNPELKPIEWIKRYNEDNPELSEKEKLENLKRVLSIEFCEHKSCSYIATMKYSDLNVCESCNDSLNREFDEEYR